MSLERDGSDAGVRSPEVQSMHSPHHHHHHQHHHEHDQHHEHPHHHHLHNHHHHHHRDHNHQSQDSQDHPDHHQHRHHHRHHHHRHEVQAKEEEPERIPEGKEVKGQEGETANENEAKSLPIDLSDVNEVQLINVTSNASSTVTDIKLVVDGTGTLIAFRQYTQRGLKAEFTLEDLQTGAVLERSGSRDVITLVGRSVCPRTGGKLDVVYLVNGVTSSKSTFHMNLVCEAGQWMVQQPQQNRQFSAIFLRANKLPLIGKVVGIEDVEIRG